MATKPQLVEIEVKYDRSTLADLAKKVPDLEVSLSSIKITNQVGLDKANELIFAGRAWCKSVDVIMDRVRDATHKAWKAAIQAQDEFKEPVLSKLKMLEAATTKFVLNAKAETARLQMLRDEQQRKENEANAKAATKDLKKMGASSEVIAAFKEDIKARRADAVAPVVEAAEGQSIRILYSAEVTDMQAFLKYLVTDNRLMILFSMSQPIKKAIESILRDEATSMKDKYELPGTRLVKSASGSWRA